MATKKLKVLNLYAGIGGNRKLWPDDEIEVTAVEINPKIAKIYQDFFPDDKVVIGDAHQYLLDNFKEFDFIWSSPPCPTHSRLVTCFTNNPLEFPDMALYQEILILKHFFKGKWVIENVISYYDPLIQPYKYRNHYYWSNFVISGNDKEYRGHYESIENLQRIKGFNLSDYEICKEKVLRNCVEPQAGLNIFNMAFKEPQQTLIGS